MLKHNLQTTDKRLDTPMAELKEVAVAFRGGEPHLARLLTGIADYAQQCGRWTLGFSPEALIMPMKNLKGWPGDGVLALLHTEAEARAARQLGRPVVNLSGALKATGLPRVVVDYRRAGSLAAEHLMERGFRRFAFYGLKHLWYSDQRKQGFVGRLEEVGFPCEVLEVPSGFDTPRPWRYWIEPLREWLARLKPPVGLLAVHDSRAALVVDACLRIGLVVPHDVAVVGVDNEPFACQFARVPLTSVSRNDRRVGYQAAALLDGLMLGERPPAEDLLVPPDGIVRRRSTDTLAVEDRDVRRMINFVNDHIHEAFGVERLERLVPFSRRSLEHRFKECLHCTPYDYINRARVQRAEDLLAAPTKQTLGQIARACGFRDTRRLRIVFRQITGTTPSDYRRRLSDF